MSENNEIPKTGTYPDMMEWLGLLAEYYPGHASGQRAQCALDTIQAQNKRVADLEAHHDGITALAKIVELQERIAELEADCKHWKAVAYEFGPSEADSAFVDG